MMLLDRGHWLKFCCFEDSSSIIESPEHICDDLMAMNSKGNSSTSTCVSSLRIAEEGRVDRATPEPIGQAAVVRLDSPGTLVGPTTDDIMEGNSPTKYENLQQTYGVFF